MRIYFLLFLVVVFFACGQPAEQRSLAKAWFFDDRSSSFSLARSVTDMSTIEYLDGASFMNLRSDGSFTCYFTEFNHGQWKLVDSSLVLSDGRKGRVIFDIAYLEGDQLVCLNRKTGRAFPFRGYDNRVGADSLSPFSIENNQWRLKPDSSESDLEIARRLKNHFRFWEKYFAWGLENGIQSLDIRSTPSVLDMYGNGFALKYYDRQFPEWRKCFYDSSNCWRAYEMVYYLMYYKDIKWENSGNRFSDFVAAFRQLQAWMDIDPKEYLKGRDSNSKAAAL